MLSPAFESDTIQESSLTPEQILYLESPLELGLRTTKPMAQHLLTLGEDRLAARIHFCSTLYKNHKRLDNTIYRQNTNPCREFALCDNCAEQRAIIEFTRYESLERILGNSFTYVECSLPASSLVRSLLSELQSPILGKVGWQDQFIVKIILTASITSISGSLLSRLRAADPSITFRSFTRDRFKAVLRHFCRPDLPPDMANRYLMKQMKRRLTFTGMNQAMREKLFGKRIKPLSNNISNDALIPPAPKPFCYISDCIGCSELYSLGDDQSKLHYRYHPPHEKHLKSA